MDYKHLKEINSPDDLKQLSEQELPELADELRQFMIESLDQCGGHFGANLGTVEITIALHYLYNTPSDKLIWDVGHQAYPHKILTGRRDQLATIKQPNGLAPFPAMHESPFDAFGTGHSSTSISAAVGYAVAAKLNQSNSHSVAIIGDGGLTGGMALEALNHAGAQDLDLLVILNDNEMSISENVGAMTAYFNRLVTAKTYTSFRERFKRIINKMPGLKRIAKKTETQIKGMIVPGALFEELGFRYFGPIDGHDLPTLLRNIKSIQNQSGPRLLHIITKKGKGYSDAEESPIKFHAVKPGFHSSKQNCCDDKKTKPVAPSYSNVFGQWLCDMAAIDKDLVGITPAMREGSDLIQFSKEYPDRYHDVGIAEQHSVTFAAGLAAAGKKPVLAIYSTFLQRGYDQLIHDVALQNLDVTFAIDRAGLVGSDGPTHSGRHDLSFLRCVPNMVVMASSNENECRQMLYTAFQYKGPAAVRYPRCDGPGVEIKKDMQAIPIGKSELIRQGNNVAILSFGEMLHAAKLASEQLDATLINMRFVKPLDKDAITQAAKSHDLIVTVEENTIMGGAGSGVNEMLAKENIQCPILNLGLPDEFLDHGKPDQMLKAVGLDADGIVRLIQERVGQLDLKKKHGTKVKLVG